MKRRSILFGIILLFLSVMNFVSCSNDDEFENEIETIKISVSFLTDYYISRDITENNPKGDMKIIEGMKIKESEDSIWKIVPFNIISDFKYEKGYDYELLVKKAIATNSSDFKYKLIKLLKKQKGGYTKMVEVHISALTGLYKSGDVTADMPSYEGMKIKEDVENDWRVVPFNRITGFVYEKGYNYKLLVEKTGLIDIPEYISGAKYKLIEILSMKKSE